MRGQSFLVPNVFFGQGSIITPLALCRTSRMFMSALRDPVGWLGCLLITVTRLTRSP